MLKKTIRWNMIKPLLPHVRSYKKELILIFIFKMLTLLISLADIYLFKILVDDVLVGGKKEYLLLVLGAYGLFYGMNTVNQALLLRQTNKFENKFKVKLRKIVCNHIIHLDLFELSKKNISEYKMNLQDDIEMIPGIILSYFMDTVLAIMIIVICFIILLRMHVLLTIGISLSVPLFFLITKKIKKELRKYSEKERTVHAQYDSWLQNSLSGWKNTQAVDFFDKEELKFKFYWEKLMDISNLKFTLWFFGRAATQVKDVFILNILLYFFGGLLIISGQITIGIMLVYINYFQTFFNKINEINNLNMSIQETKPISDRINAYLNICENDRTKYSNIPLYAEPQIQFRDVSFRYKDEMDDILQDIGITFSGNEKIFITGRSGEGKSTFLALLLRLYKPCTGSILLNGSEIQTIKPEDYHKYISGCLQDVFMFSMTIYDNLKMANMQATEEDIINACKLVEIHDFISSLPNSYNTMLSQNGENLSGGQKQRIALARIILRNTEVLILDEATTALDARTETLIFNLIHSQFKDKMVFIVSHNYDLKEYCDYSLRVEEQKICEDV